MNDQGPADLAAFIIVGMLVIIAASVFADFMGWLEGYRR